MSGVQNCARVLENGWYSALFSQLYRPLPPTCLPACDECSQAFLVFCRSSTIRVLPRLMPSPHVPLGERVGPWDETINYCEHKRKIEWGRSENEASWVALSPITIWYDTTLVSIFTLALCNWHLHAFHRFQLVDLYYNVCRNCCTNCNWTRVEKCLKCLQRLSLSLQNRPFLWTGFVAFLIWFLQF